MELYNPIEITRITTDSQVRKDDVVAVEAQYCVKLNDNSIFTFTCTPSHLEEMVTGMLYSRKLILSAEQIKSMQIDGACITVTISDAPGQHACQQKPVHPAAELLFQTVQTLFSDPSTLFNRTGCAHSCSLMRSGEILCSMEDIGRHNALDKVIGYALRSGIPLGECIIFTSGRISGDYMAKIIQAGFPAAVSRAAVTSEAVRLAKAHGVALYGFVRGNSANLYT